MGPACRSQWETIGYDGDAESFDIIAIIDGVI